MYQSLGDFAQPQHSDVGCPVWRSRVPEACPIRVICWIITTSTLKCIVFDVELNAQPSDMYRASFVVAISSPYVSGSHLYRIALKWQRNRPLYRGVRRAACRNGRHDKHERLHSPCPRTRTSTSDFLWVYASNATTRPRLQEVPC